MKHLALCLAVLVPLPAAAQDGDISDGADLMRKGAGILLRGMIDEIGPENIIQMKRLADLVQDWDKYEMPEVLPNGDLLIRRKPEVPAEPEDRTVLDLPGPEIDL